LKRYQTFLTAIPVILVLLGCNQAARNDDRNSPFDRFDDNVVTQPKSTSQPSEAIQIGAQKNEVTDVSESPKVVGKKFYKCGRARVTCVVDGDTIWLNGVKIRIADIDTPEISRPKCLHEKALGDKATNRLVELINEGPFQTVRVGGQDEDRYGRKLRNLVRDGHSLGDQLVNEGLARSWTGRREPWC
jgi:endonuclease YncB( thermonuclease family)